jgi:ribosomal protein S18 acetylase RimI-like enzyme
MSNTCCEPKATFPKSEWESGVTEKVSQLPYYYATVAEDEPVPPKEELPEGVYAVKTLQDLKPKGYERVFSAVTLAAPPLPFGEHGDRRVTISSTWDIEGWKPAIGWDWDDLREHFVRRTISLFGFDEAKSVRNRLRATLLTREALYLMEQWVFNCFTGRCNDIAVSFEDGKPAGFVALRRTIDVSWIDLLAVDPKHRGKGHGTALALWARRCPNTRRIEVTTEDNNPAAIQMYQKAGFTVKETVPLWFARVR